MACNCRLSLSASSSGTLVDHKTITGVPLTTRNFAQVLSMSSGTAADVNNAGTLGRGTSTVNVNGSTAAGSYTIEGAYAPSTVPNPDAIAEFKIQTSQYDAGYGAHGAQHQRDHTGRRESVSRHRLGICAQRHFQCQCVLSECHRATQTESETKPVRSDAGRPGPQG